MLECAIHPITYRGEGILATVVKSDKEKTDYIYLLQKEKFLIDNIQNTLQNKAMKLYQKCIAKPDSSLAARCCNFKMLEEKCLSYLHISPANL